MQNTATQPRQNAQKAAAHQQILMDARGFIIESTDTIFSTFPQRHRPAMEWSTFLESIFPHLVSLNLHSEELYFPRIQSITNNIFGLYDCSFMCVEWLDIQNIIVWNIIDNSADIQKIQQTQQAFNEIRLRGMR
jgi:hypothetical protein